MATKPNETYKWGENATHEQVAAYDDTGWPSDVIPPKRTQFNWYQNLVGKWLGWAEDAVDDIVETVLERWFVGIPESVNLWPNKSGIYHIEGDSLVFMVEDTFALSIQPLWANGISVRMRSWIGSEWGAPSLFIRSNTRASVLQESEANYVTPNGLVDYFSVKGTAYLIQSMVPHQTGVYLIGIPNRRGVSIVIDDDQVYIPLDNSTDGMAFTWDGSEWVLQQ